MRLLLRIPLPAAARTYATRRAERPPPKIKDPLSSTNATHHQITPNLTFTHRVPPTAPTPFSLTTAPASPLLSSPTPPTGQPDASTSAPSTRFPPLPPLMKGRRPNPLPPLSKEQVEEIKRLRAEDPIKNTRRKLAKQFGCSPRFVPMAAPLDPEEKRKALEHRDREHQANRDQWGEKKKLVVMIRQKRRSLW